MQATVNDVADFHETEERHNNFLLVEEVCLTKKEDQNCFITTRRMLLVRSERADKIRPLMHVHSTAGGSDGRALHAL